MMNMTAILAVLCGITAPVLILLGSRLMGRRMREFEAAPHDYRVFPPPQARMGLPFALVSLGLVSVCAAVLLAIIGFNN